ncbi:hypothetical protein [Pseudanabaena mucicola]|uniref:DUF4159 domain-containing protein n=1 Tax=Pseudanabaena mucicola FACHB-723 TaxID=2692860 RepID=A0ABR8A0U1_9CYAN|nr:hypothetical protein [Pseudanabaena mucicola]MBD2189410.1 hypothetical protein [Pseudanabaena mucicola FACHB-723]
MNDFPYPQIQPFERLQVSDGLMINSERWRLAHEYHQQRQNVQYQSLFLPGIICGLGVVPIQAPADLPAKFRDGRWVQIQPGMAIDLQGNFIVVPTPLDFRISSTAYDTDIATVYLVLSYVDPAKLKRASSNEVLVETFRVNEKTDLPLDTDIEICRIAIAEGQLEIQKSPNVFAPAVSQLDMRHRIQAQLRPQNCIRVAHFQESQNLPAQQTAIAISTHLQSLGQSLPSLAPQLRLINPIANLDIHGELTLAQLRNYHLLYLSYSQALALNDSTQLALREYAAIGGAILIEVAIHDHALKNLLEIYYELRSAHQRLKKTIQSQLDRQQQSDQSLIMQELESELDAIRDEINNATQDILNPLRERLPLGNQLQSFSDLPTQHPLRSQPFLLPQLSGIIEQPMQIMGNDAVIIIFGELSPVWSGESPQDLSRSTIRNCQELGINILNYAAQRWEIHQSMQINPQYQMELATTSDQRRITNMVDTAP